jgi:hypothetical protein
MSMNNYQINLSLEKNPHPRHRAFTPFAFVEVGKVSRAVIVSLNPANSQKIRRTPTTRSMCLGLRARACVEERGRARERERERERARAVGGEWSGGGEGGGGRERETKTRRELGGSDRVTATWVA